MRTYFVLKPMFLSAWACIYLILFSSNAFSQQSKQEIDKSEKCFVMVSKSDQINNYLSLDLSQLPGFFERAYLLDLIFADPNVLIDQTNIFNPTLEVISSKSHDLSFVINSLNKYFHQSIEAGKDLPPEKKEVLMQKYAKYYK
jgi:hypothetical protein